MESDLEEEEILHGREVDLVFRGIALVYTPDRHLGIRYVSVFVELAQWSLISTMNRIGRSCSYISMINR